MACTIYTPGPLLQMCMLQANVAIYLKGRLLVSLFWPYEARI